ncbi:MAG: hypothetical protein EZS28_015947 [Streblomastix strix]|uniref:Uncharacterized protein n=1 Tax=Streblomastix strix TaxID=222440 RepID=A0A5J4W103_9EUKA|nr:MAG: hypothetical protein EZS28_015947 [Streblomastix strix]
MIDNIDQKIQRESLFVRRVDRQTVRKAPTKADLLKQGKLSKNSAMNQFCNGILEYIYSRITLLQCVASNWIKIQQQLKFYIFLDFKTQMLKQCHRYQEAESVQSSKKFLKVIDVAWDLNLYRHIFNMRQLSMFEILQYLQRQFFYHAKWIQNRMDYGNPVTEYNNFSNIKENLKIKESTSSGGSDDNSRLAYLQMVPQTQRNHSVEIRHKKKFTILTEDREEQTQKLSTATWVNLPILFGSKTKMDYFNNYYMHED